MSCLLCALRAIYSDRDHQTAAERAAADAATTTTTTTRSTSTRERRERARAHTSTIASAIAKAMTSHANTAHSHTRHHSIHSPMYIAGVSLAPAFIATAECQSSSPLSPPPPAPTPHKQPTIYLVRAGAYAWCAAKTVKMRWIFRARVSIETVKKMRAVAGVGGDDDDDDDD